MNRLDKKIGLTRETENLWKKETVSN